jgi:hypothetical protein
MNTLLLCLSVLAISLLGSLGANASPVTADAIYGPTPGNLIIYNGGAAIQVPKLQGDSGFMLSTNNIATVNNKTFTNQNNVSLQCEASYDFAVLGGSSAAPIPLTGTCKIPANSVIQRVWIDTITQPTTGGVGSWVSLQLANFGDLLGPTALSVLTAGESLGTPAGTTATSFKTSGSAGTLTPQILIGVHTLSAGKFNVFVDYLTSF